MPADDRDDEDDRPRRRRDEDDDDYDDGLPRRRRRAEGDATGGLIPYKNAKALAAYYCGVFSLIPCIGGVLGIIAIVLGVMGLSHAKKFPESRGQAHAVVGIVLGSLVLLGHLVVTALIAASAATK